MNHDEKNPNPDMQPWIEPELEARVVAWVMGEASPFEIAELERLLREKPELAIFKRRIEAVHGLVGEAARPDPAPLKMSAERRAKLLQTIGVMDWENVLASVEAPVVMPTQAGKKKSRWWLQPWAYGAAASMAVGLFVITQVNFMQKAPRPDPAPTAIALDLLEPPRGVPSSARLALAQEVSPPSVHTALPEVAPALSAAPLLPETRLMTGPAPELTMPSPAPLVENRFTAQGAAASFGGGGAGGGRGGRGGRGGGRGGAAGTIGADAVRVSSPAPTQVSAAPAASPVAAAPGALPAPNELPSFEANLPARDLAEPLAKAKRQVEMLNLPAAALDVRQSAEALALSPFTVSTDKDLGYAATNTIAGARLNTSLSDLGSSITVQTKEELANVASPPVFRGFGQFADEKKRDEREADDALQRARRPAEPAPKVEEASTAKEPVSTFSLHVSDVSFRLAQAALARGEVPEPARIRPEEFYNAFDYGDPAPTLAEKVGARIEQSAHPVLQQRNLVRVAFKVPAAGRSASQPLRLTVLLDTSGSMEREDRVATVRRALQALGGLLGPQDRVTLIGFARQPRLLAENVPGSQAAMLVGLVANTPVEGGTNLEEALKLASQLARRHQLAGAQNRVVLLTDGAANLGNANPAQLATAVETLRQQGIAFDACGVGLNGLDDGVLEALTRRGDGRYYVLDSPEAADAGFARQLAGAFRPAAENVKVQVRFNPARVAHYRLIGFDQHRLSEQDFRNDAVDAAELAAEEAAVALYEVEVLPQGSGEVGELFVRFRDPASGMMVERSWTIAYDAQARPFDRATPSLQLAGASALLAEKLRQSPVAGQFKLSDLTAVVNSLRGSYGYEPRVQELVTMFDQARRLGRD